MPFEYDQDKLILNLQNSSPGFYFIRIQDGSKIYKGKINQVE